MQELLDFPLDKAVKPFRKRFRTDAESAALARRRARKDSRCDAASGPIVSLALPAAAVVVAALVALVVIGAGPGRGDRACRSQPAHKCLVMTGSGDPAFTKNFNPYTGTGLPSGTIVQGAFYEPLIVTPARAG